MKKIIYILLLVLYTSVGCDLLAQDTNSEMLTWADNLFPDYEAILLAEKGVINDSIPVYMFLLKYDTDDYRIAVSMDGYFYEETNSWEIKVKEFPSRVYVKDNKLLVRFEDNRRVAQWDRTLTFNPIVSDLNLSWQLVSDDGVASTVENEQPVVIKKTIKDFGDVFLNEINFDSRASKFSLSDLESAIRIDYDNKALNEFLEKIDDNKTIVIKKKIYNLSSINYERAIEKGKKVTVKEGVLKLEGFSNIKFIFAEGAYMTNNADFSDVITFKNCSRIEVHNLHAFHNVEGNCHAPVIGLEGCKNMLFENCLIDGSGLIGFDLHTSKRIRIVKSTITNCSQMALYLVLSSVRLNEVRIENNEMRNIFHAYKSKITVKNSVIKDNTIDFFAKIDATSVVKIKNSQIVLNTDVMIPGYRSDEGILPEFINTEIQYEK